ncbi:MAG: efflux RND transporter periplasmic adaptor subunit [Pirellulaceae bacterium]
MKQVLNKLPWIVAGLVLVALLVYGYWPRAVEVDLVTVSRGILEVTVNDDGETRIREKYIVSAPVAGKLLRVQRHAGDAVQQGQTELARIQPGDPSLLDARTRAEYDARMRAAESAVEQANATLEHAREVLALAQDEFARADSLIGTNAISQAEYDAAEHLVRIAIADVKSAEFAVKVAQFDLESAQAVVSRYDVDAPQPTESLVLMVSPIDGHVLRVFQEDAAVVAPGAPILELGNPQDLEIEIDVLSTDAVRIEPGDMIYVDQWGGEEPLAARVRLVEPSAFLKVSALGVEEKRVNVIADFVEPWTCRKSLGDGFRVEARIVVDKTAEDSIKVPAGALFREREQWFVYRVIGGVARLQAVTTGKSNGMETEITAGLADDDTVVLHPGSKVRDGVRVKQFQ